MTKVNDIMKKDKIGSSSQQLYSQFLYRITLMKKIFNLTNVNIAIFAPSLYMSGTSFSGLRKVFLNEFKFIDGVLFNASHFADVKSSWAIDFSIWKSGKSIDKTNFKHKIKDLSETGRIESIGEKIIYNLDNSQKCCDWIKTIKPEKEEDAITLKSSLNISNKIVKQDVNNLGFLINDSNNIYANTQGVYIMSAKITRHIKTTTILAENFKECVSLFSARNLIKENWVNQKDEYKIPNINHQKYKEWNNDSIIYSIFNTSSNQSSLRDIEYDSKSWNIKNEFFFMFVDEIEELANEYENDDIYEDIKEFGDDRYVYKILQDIELSDEAQNVLDKAIELIKKSFKFREIFNEEKPEYHINTWDAGWYQIKGLLNQYMKEDYKEFTHLYKVLEDKMRPMVYELGFLI